MDLIDKLQALSARATKQLSHLETEEATKTALVLPFIGALGYDVFDPTQVVPEFTADVGIKKGEKVDYAILADGEPIILFECKSATTDLGSAHANQLYRYFSATTARFGVLTNGVDYRVYTDLDAPNRMDDRPFLEFSVLEIGESDVRELKKFAKGQFDVDTILSTASELKYSDGIRRIFSEEWVNPSDDFVKLFASRVYSGRMTQSAREQFTNLTKRAFREFVNGKIKERLTSALNQSQVDPPSSGSAEDSEEPSIETTSEELEAYYVVRAILRDVVDVRRVFMRDRQSYCGILLDDNNRKPLCRLWFNRSRNYLGTFDEEKNETKHPIEDISDIYSHAERLIRTAQGYDEGVPSAGTSE